MEVAPDQPLMEAGLDSIGAVELRNAVGAKFGVDLPATVTFDHPTPQALARFLAAREAPLGGAHIASSGVITHTLLMEEDSHALEHGIAQVLPLQPSVSVKAHALLCPPGCCSVIVCSKAHIEVNMCL